MQLVVLDDDWMMCCVKVLRVNGMVAKSVLQMRRACEPNGAWEWLGMGRIVGVRRVGARRVRIR